jgi:hypothetical protein
MHNAKWLAAILLAFMVALTLLFFSLAQVARESTARQILTRTLELSLLPEGLSQETRLVEVKQGLEYSPGEPLVLIPGVNVSIPAAEIAGIQASEARSRIALTLADDVLAGGAGLALQRVSDPVLQNQLAKAFADTLPVLSQGLLETSMLPAGLDNGSRLANWSLQALQKPGEPVQPIVGIFVFVDPDILRPLSRREIGEYVVGRLARAILEQGLAATQELISNADLLSRLSTTAALELRQELANYFETLLVAKEGLIAERLEQARDILKQQAASEVASTIQGITQAEALEGLSPEAANALVLNDLTTAIYERGVAATLPLLTDSAQATRVKGASPILTLFTGPRQQYYLRLTWLFGLLAVFLLVLFLVFSWGWGSLLGLGLILMVSASLGTLLFGFFGQRIGSLTVSAPQSLLVDGVPGYFFTMQRYLLSNIPADVLQLFARNHLFVWLAGVALAAIFFLLQLSRLFRPRRRSLL